MEEFIHIISKLDVQNLIAMAAMLWIFKVHLDKKFEKIDQRFEKIDQRFEKIDQRIDKIEQKLNELDKRLVAIETIIHLKDFCMLRNDRIQEKAE